MYFVSQDHRANALSNFHLIVSEHAFDVNPTVCLDGAIAAVHGAYPWRTFGETQRDVAQ